MTNMTILTRHFNVSDYFDLYNVQSRTILKFWYVEWLFITHTGDKNDYYSLFIYI